MRNFGKRYDPLSQRADYFNLGLDISAPAKTPVYPILDGVLEYAGYGVQNGRYVMLSHPNITTEDGFVFHTIYMHLRSADVGFTQYQKMLREISLRTYPEIHVSSTTKIGEVGDTGNAEGLCTQLHLQCEFRHKDGTIIAVDPAMLLGFTPELNITASISTPEEFTAMFDRYQGEIREYGVEKYWARSLDTDGTIEEHITN